MADIRNAGTLEVQVTPRAGYYDVFFTSNPAAGYFDSTAPYAKHTNEKIRIHAYLALPLFGSGPFPAIVIGHGHGGQADLTLTQNVAFLGYVALSIDGPQAGQSTGGPRDENQAWISVDDGPQYSYLYHYAYAGMRAVTLLEHLSRQTGNPYRIDANKLAALGASMGGLLTTYMNGIDARLKAAIAIVSAGNWPTVVRYPNGWLYHGLYTATRDLPYNGADPINSIENVDNDPTAITFMNYFDPIRYGPQQHAPILTIIGTHDEYFPFPAANLQQLAFDSAGTHANFEKRLWLIPNATHGLENASSLTGLASGARQWLEYAFGNRARPLATPRIALSSGGAGLRFEITLAETAARLAGASIELQVATKVDSRVTPIKDFKAYAATWQGDRYVATLPPGEKTAAGDLITADNALYFATITDSGGLPVSSLFYKGQEMLDASSAYQPGIDPWPSDTIVAPVPPPPADAAEAVSSSIPNPSNSAYQGMALSNPGSTGKRVRVEARTPDGRIAAAEGLINPISLYIPANSQQVFVAEEWFGRGAGKFNGSLHAFWSESNQSSLSFRGSVGPTELDGIGPVRGLSAGLWLPLIPEQDPAANRKIRIFGGATAADVQIIYRDSNGEAAAIPPVQVKVPARGTADVIPPMFVYAAQPASAEIKASSPLSARMEVSGAKDTWSVEARWVPSATRYFQPHTEWNGTFTTRLVLLNPSSSVRVVRPHLRTRIGAEVGIGSTVEIKPWSVFTSTVESLFGGAGSQAGAGWIDIDSPDGPILVEALAVDLRTGASASSAVEGGVAGTFSMPFYVESLGYWTGLAIVSAGNLETNLTIQALDRGGKVLGSWAEKLGPLQSSTKLVSQWIQGLPLGTTGQIVITSSAPAALLAYFGTDDGAALAAIPFTPVP